jgi:hypothetical protein
MFMTLPHFINGVSLKHNNLFTETYSHVGQNNSNNSK